VNFNKLTEILLEVTTKGFVAENTGRYSKEKFKEYFENRY